MNPCGVAQPASSTNWRKYRTLLHFSHSKPKKEKGNYVTLLYFLHCLFVLTFSTRHLCCFLFFPYIHAWTLLTSSDQHMVSIYMYWLFNYGAAKQRSSNSFYTHHWVFTAFCTSTPSLCIFLFLHVFCVYSLILLEQHRAAVPSCTTG